MLDQGNALRQELHNHQLTQYVEESQMSTMRNTLEHQQKRSHNKELQFQAAKRQFHEQKVTVQNLRREVYRVTRSETSLQQQHVMQVRTLTQERDQQRLSLLSRSFLPETNSTRKYTIPWRRACYEEEEQKFAEDYKVLRTEWDEWSTDQAAELAATQCPAPTSRSILRSRAATYPVSTLDPTSFAVVPCGGKTRERYPSSSLFPHFKFSPKEWQVLKKFFGARVLLTRATLGCVLQIFAQPIGRGHAQEF